MNPHQVKGDVVAGKLNGKGAYLDPAAGYVSYGSVTWEETGVSGLRLDKEGGSWITTPIPESLNSQIVRNADLNLSNGGPLKVKYKDTCSKLYVLWTRQDNRT